MRISVLAFLLFGLMPICESLAGGGPENVFLLVNSTSQDSMTVANHYIEMRKIPSSNIFYLEWDKEKPWTNGTTFRENILLPALGEIEKRGLSNQIDYLIYSCDFPWKITFAGDFPDAKFTPGNQPQGSITGSTYLWAFVKDKRKEMFGLTSNNYFSRQKNGVTISRAFQSQYRWLPNAQRTDLKGLPYMLSVMLGVTYGGHLTVDEILAYLKSASQADATNPQGTVYFLKHTGPRSTPRHDLYPAAVRELSLAGVKAEIIEGRFPKDKKDIIGLTTGVTSFDISRSGCRMLPGSIGDNLTSAGGYVQPGKGQTRLTEFLTHGAAGACGTVHEPLNYPHKFPSPFLYVHYAHGCSLAESFYQSISAPFQQLIVGDPLCQPWAHIPEVKVRGVQVGGFVSGTITLTPFGIPAQDREIEFFELFVDGILLKRCRPGDSFDLDTTNIEDGYHELRVVAIDNTPIETQGRWIGAVNVKNNRNAVQLSFENQDQLSRAAEVVLRVASTQRSDVSIVHNGRQLTKVTGGNGIARIDAGKLGSGPVSLQAVDEGEKAFRSKPVHIELP